MPKGERKSIRVEMDREDYAALKSLARERKEPMTFVIRALVRAAANRALR